MISGPNRAHPPYWDATTMIPVCPVSGCFPVTTMELKSCNRDLEAHKT